MVQNGELLIVNDLSVYFRTDGDPVRAVDRVSFTVRDGETVALVGESGCGKTVTALSLARLVPIPGYLAGGAINVAGREVAALRDAELQQLRGSVISYVFQEPGTSLNPVFRVGRQIGEAFRIHRREGEVDKAVIDMMRLVGLSDPERRCRAYPHELSGGMQQRVMIAMALACRPRLLVADEPTTALDVTIQAQIMELLAALQKKLSMSILLITHNFGLVADIAQRVNVMYAGRIVECGPTARVLTRAAHPYTRALLAAVPRLGTRKDDLAGIPGSVPNPARLPNGCKFHPRCPLAQDVCRAAEPEFTILDGEHGVRCHFSK